MLNETTTGLPDLAGLKTLLTPYLGSGAYVIPITSMDGSKALGNNGDKIMHEVFYRVLRAFSITLSDSAADADVMIVPPNGALLEVYQFPEILESRLRGFETIPLVIFPSSALFPTRDPSFIFENRRAETLWIMREKYSYDHLSQKWLTSLAKSGVRLALDHDVVASGNQFVREILGKPSSGGGALIAGRKDRESTDIRTMAGSRTHGAPASRLKRFKRLVPYGPLYTAAARFARKQELEAAASSLVAKLSFDDQRVVGRAKTGIRVDLSAPQYATYPQFLSALRRADVVVTNRLHVALPSAVIGKRVFLVEAGYHKLQGVYERSLEQLPNVTLILP